MTVVEQSKWSSSSTADHEQDIQAASLDPVSSEKTVMEEDEDDPFSLVLLPCTHVKFR